MRIALLFALGGCFSSEPVREGQATIRLDSADRGVATYRVVSGSNDSECAHGEHFTPLTGAAVRFGPTGGELVPLAETAEAGAYAASAPTLYAPSYQFSVDGELFDLPAPAYFSAAVQSISNTQATIEFSDATTPSYVVVRSPDGRNVGHMLAGSPAAIDADFSQRGEYQLELVRSVESSSGIVEIQRQITLTMP
jgi:hypothetical protein